MLGQKKLNGKEINRSNSVFRITLRVHLKTIHVFLIYFFYGRKGETKIHLNCDFLLTRKILHTTTHVSSFLLFHQVNITNSIKGGCFSFLSILMALLQHLPQLQLLVLAVALRHQHLFYLLPPHPLTTTTTTAAAATTTTIVSTTNMITVFTSNTSHSILQPW